MIIDNREIYGIVPCYKCGSMPERLWNGFMCPKCGKLIKDVALVGVWNFR